MRRILICIETPEENFIANSLPLESSEDDAEEEEE